MREFDKGSLILIAGATGYIGGHLLKALEKDGCRIRCLARKPDALQGKTGPGTEVVKGDIFGPLSLGAAFEGVHTAYYLIHSMAAKGDFVEKDRIAAKNFGDAASRAGVRRIIYLGGLSHSARLSAHLRSRQETGRVLRESGIPVIEFRASIIIGAGSISFEIMRGVTERVPIMAAAKWSTTECQPIYIGDVIRYLVAALEKPYNESRIFEIGAPDVSCYVCLMQEYAKLRGLRRFTLPIPFLNPVLATYPLVILTPKLYRVGRWLIRGLGTRTVVEDNSALEEFSIKPLSTIQAIETALADEDREFAETSWSHVLVGVKRKPWGGFKFGNRYVDTYLTHFTCPPECAFRPIKCLGGETGWYCGATLRTIRGFVDLLAGGPGLRCCRPPCVDLTPGDIVDCWRVELFQPGGRLRFSSEMKVPGRAWLDFEVTPEGDGSSVRITAIFDPKGISGLAYWFSIYPFHSHIFRGMLREMAKKAKS